MHIPSLLILCVLACTYAGSWAPIPPDSITTKLGFDYSTGELRLEITSDDLSPGRWYAEVPINVGINSSHMKLLWATDCVSGFKC